MIDIHCHILPGFDDGSDNLEESLTMARMAAASGVTGIVATPHFRGEKASLPSLPTLYGKYLLLNEFITRENPGLTLYPGAEILCLPETIALAKSRLLPTIGDTDYLLVEFFFNAPADYLNGMLRSLAELGYRPVIAHPERYDAVRRDPRLLESWFRRGYVLQLNKGSVLGSFGPQVEKTALFALRNGLAHLIASDAHGASRRTTDMTTLLQWLRDNCPEEYTRVLLERNPNRLVRGEGMVPVK